MADPYMGEIRMFAGNFAPEHWAFCDGQILPISQFQALYSVMGTEYGGDGRTSFAVPNLKDRTPMGNGTGPGLTPRRAGQMGGTIYCTLTTEQIPAHNHLLYANEEEADLKDPKVALIAKGKGWKQGFFVKTLDLYNTEVPSNKMHEETVHSAGGSQGHVNVQPYLAVYFIMCLNGIYPPRS